MPETQKAVDELRQQLMDKVGRAFDEFMTYDAALRRRTPEIVMEFGDQSLERKDWSFDSPDDRVTFRLTTNFDLRLKTAAERGNEVHERAEEIIQQHTRKTCITCNKEIKPEEDIIKTVHGFYHGEPYTCVEGRDE